MVDDFAAIWPIVALDGVGDLICDARPGLVAIDGGRRLGFANAAAAALLGPDARPGGPLGLDPRLAERIARFAARARPGEETRELLRFTQAGRPMLRTVVLRRPIESDDAVVALVDGRAETEIAPEAGLAAFAADGGLVALFDADGDIVAALGDFALAEGLENEIAAVLGEDEDVAVLERTLTDGDRRHDLALVRLGDRPDARRLLRLGPARATRAAAVATAIATPVETPVAPPPSEIAPAARAPDGPLPPPPQDGAAAPAETVTASASEEPAEIDDEDRFVAAPPLALDPWFEDDDTDAHLAEAWSRPDAVEPTLVAPISDDLSDVAVEPTAAEPVEPETAIAEAATALDEPNEPLEAPLVEPIEEPIAVVAPIADDLTDVAAEPIAAEPVEFETAIVETATALAGPVEPLPLVAVPLAEGESAAEVEDGLPEPATRLAPAPSTPAAFPEDDGAAAAAAEESAAAGGRRFAPPTQPVKFVWQMDAERRFTLISEEFADVVGPAAADVVGARWDEVAARFDLDADGAVAAALSRRDTWSGRTVLWPIEGEALRLPVDLAALPMFDRGRSFGGFRGFGTCRAEAAVPDPAGLGLRLAEARDPSPAAFEPEAEIACVVESLAEPPLYAGDPESAAVEPDHPIEAAFAGEIDADPIAAAAAPEPELDREVPAPIATPPDASASSVAPRAEVEASANGRAAIRLVDPDGVVRPSEDAARLSAPERTAFRQIAEVLGARIEGEPTVAERRPPREREAAAPRPTAALARPPVAAASLGAGSIDPRLLDRLPVAVALTRDDVLVYANERFLALLRYPDLASLAAAGGVDALFAGPHVAERFEDDGARVMPVIARDGTVLPCDAQIASVPWNGTPASMLTLTERRRADVAAPTSSAADAERIVELQAIVDTATDGVLILDGAGLVLSANAAAEALFGVERRAMIGRPLADRLAPESRRSAMDYLDGLASNGVASVLNDGREVIGVVSPEGLIPLFMTIGRVSTGPIAKYCAVLRDITQWKKSEEELTSARRRAEEASIHKSDFLARISHEIRTPLNAIIGFSELMLDERFGPIGNDRYKDYLRDIHVSGSHIMSLVNDLLDLSKVEAGKMDLRFEAVPLAEVVGECVALMQPQANRERIIIRSSLPADVPPVVADPRSMRQVVLNLLSNAVKFTPAGGQVIVSITLEDNGEVVLRVRDTGYGMSEKELQTAMEPFRQLHTTRSRSGGTGLGLPLTKALAEANRAAFRIDSTVGQGTLASIVFPVTRVLAG